jgi:hypothetical protein
MDHLLYICDHHSAKIRTLLGKALMLSISRHTGEYISAFALRLLEIVFNKPHSSLLPLQDSNTQKVVILLLQEVKHDNVF